MIVDGIDITKLTDTDIQNYEDILSAPSLEDRIFAAKILSKYREYSSNDTNADNPNIHIHKKRGPWEDR